MADSCKVKAKNNEIAPKKGLLIAPEFPRDAFWSYQYILRFIGCKAAFPPLGLLSFAAWMPDYWDFELVDLNVRRLSDRVMAKKIREADAVFVSAMSIQKPSLVHLLSGPAAGSDTPWILGGPLASTYRDQILSPQTESDSVLYSGLDQLVWGEAGQWIETINRLLEQNPRHSSGSPALLIPEAVSAAEPGTKASRAYLNDRTVFRPLDDTPPPRWDLIRVKDYRALAIQTTVGCPFRCDFCDVIRFNGGFSRAKTRAQVRAELQAIYETGHRGGLFTVDDNFIGNPEAISLILDDIIEFQRAHDYPFELFTQASVNVGKPKLEHLVTKMKQAGFDGVFLGIENPDPVALHGMNKKQNTSVDLDETVRKFQRQGIEVYGGFIFGCDSDRPATARSIIDFVRSNHIVSAMAGMLTPLPHTPLYQQLKLEGRLIDVEYTGNNTDDDIQFYPKLMTVDNMREGIYDILNALFDAEDIYRRAEGLLHNMQPNVFSPSTFALWPDAKAACVSIWKQGLRRLDPSYFRFLAAAWKLDRSHYRSLRKSLAEFGSIFAHPPKTGHITLDETTASRIHDMLSHAYEDMIRFRAEMSLGQVTDYIGGVREQLSRGVLAAGDLRQTWQAAQHKLRLQMKQLEFPGAHLVMAFELAVKGYHYEMVKKAIVSHAAGGGCRVN